MHFLAPPFRLCPPELIGNELIPEGLMLHVAGWQRRILSRFPHTLLYRSTPMIEHAFPSSGIACASREEKETALDKNSTSSTPTTPHTPKKDEADPAIAENPVELSANTTEQPAEGLAPRMAARAESGASTHPTG
jgi:hypothetical protein